MRSSTFATHLAALALLAAAAGCHKTPAVATIDPNDPASANFAPVGPQNSSQAPLPARVLADREQEPDRAQGESYPDAQQYDAPQQPDNGMYEADQPPPQLPAYAQPVATQPNTIWTPGYWQHGPGGFYWVPGAWVAPPFVGALWTPGYWASDGPRYRFHPGFWGRHVGFYGGVPYGGGYPGRGYYGGYWNGPRFVYNRAVSPIDPDMIHDVYDRPEPIYAGVRFGFNGPGGVNLLPIAAELYALHEAHERPLPGQYQLERESGLRWGVRPLVIERPVLVERPGPPGHAYGLWKDHGNPHFDQGDQGDRGEGHGRGNAWGHGPHDDGGDGGPGQGHGEGHGHSH